MRMSTLEETGALKRIARKINKNSQAQRLSGFGEMVQRELTRLGSPIQIEDHGNTVLLYDENYSLEADPFVVISELQKLDYGTDSGTVWNAINEAAGLMAVARRIAVRKNNVVETLESIKYAIPSIRNHVQSSKTTRYLWEAWKALDKALDSLN